MVCAIWRGEGPPSIPGLAVPVLAALTKDDLDDADAGRSGSLGVL